MTIDDVMDHLTLELAVKEIDDLLTKCAKTTLIESSKVADTLLDIRNTLVPIIHRSGN